MAGRGALTSVASMAGFALLLLLLPLASARQVQSKSIRKRSAAYSSFLGCPSLYHYPYNSCCCPWINGGFVPGEFMFPGYPQTWPVVTYQNVPPVMPKVPVSAAEKVRVGVYFESLCSDSMRFFTEQLYPAWTQLHDIMDLHLIPYGKANNTLQSNGDYTFECQHGANECHGNKVMSCVQNFFPIDTQVKMTHCMMAKNYPAFAGEQCARELGLDWAPLDSCSRSFLGSQLLYQNGLKTDAIKPVVGFFIPTIIINGEYYDAEHKTSLRAFKAQVCNAYTGPPHQNCF